MVAFAGQVVLGGLSVLFPGSGHDVLLVDTFAPSGDAGELDVVEAADVCFGGCGSEVDPARDAACAGARLADAVSPAKCGGAIDVSGVEVRAVVNAGGESVKVVLAEGLLGNDAGGEAEVGAPHAVVMDANFGEGEGVAGSDVAQGLHGPQGREVLVAGEEAGEGVLKADLVVAVVRGALAVVAGVAAPAGLEALEVGEGARVELEGEDVGVELLGSVTEEALLELTSAKRVSRRVARV